MAQEKRESAKVDLLDNKAFLEVLQSELIHRDRITFLEAVLLLEIQKPDPIIKLTASITRLKEISNALLENSKKSIKISLAESKNENIEENDPVRMERRVLLSQFFKEYKEYIPLYNGYILDCYENPKNYLRLDGLLQQFNGLQSMLILPIQRGPRYLMLIDALIGNKSQLPKEAYRELKKLKAYLLVLLKDINESVTPLSAPAPATAPAAPVVDDAPKPLRHKFPNLGKFVEDKKKTISYFRKAKDAASYFSVDDEIDDFVQIKKLPVSVVPNSMFNRRENENTSDSELELKDTRAFDDIPYDEGAETFYL